jgi:hypothetical protein
LNSVVKNFGLRGHEEAWVAANLAKLAVAHLGLDDAVDEAEGEGVLLHFHGVQVVESELGNALNPDGKLPTEICLLCFKIDFFIDQGS